MRFIKYDLPKTSNTFQKALTEQNINLNEVDKEVLGTFSEKQDPSQSVEN